MDEICDYQTILPELCDKTLTLYFSMTKGQKH